MRSNFHETNPLALFVLKMLGRKLENFFPKPIDFYALMCYNNYSKNKGEIKMVVGFSISVIILVILIICNCHTNNSIIYKDYRIGEYVFTVHLSRDSDGDVRIEVYDWHLPPHTKRERIKQWWKLKSRDYFYWRPSFTSLNLEEYILERIETVISRIEEEKYALEEWERISK